jgi:hypothetical protein
MPVKMTLTSPNLEAVAARYNEAPAIVERESHLAMEKSVFYLEGQVKRLTPVVTGTLRRSVTGRSTTMGPVVLGLVFSPQNYAAVVERGARPRQIFPRKKKALYWPGARHPVAYVNWPGFRGRFMFQRGLEKSRPQINQFFDNALQIVSAYIDGA